MDHAPHAPAPLGSAPVGRRTRWIASHAPRLRLRAAWIALGVVVAFLALGFVGDRVTSSALVCGACHEMRSKVVSWSGSSHAQVGCPACHESPRPWYRFSETLAERGSRFRRDLDAHWANGSGSVPSTVATGTATTTDEACLRCHDPSRVVTVRDGTLIDHAEHAKRNESCLSCHLSVAHPDPTAERPLLLMARCFTCHGRSRDAKAPGTCDVCHPRSFDVRPKSHAPRAWRTAHGKVAKADRQTCDMCHEETFCRDCHGLDMPHPAGWEKGRTGHSIVAKKARRVCERCHTPGPELCNMCHHEGYEPAARRPWILQHPVVVQKRGVSFCLTQCHTPTFCPRCHIGGA